MKFLIHSNAPTVPSGYGVQTALLADRLAADGHEVDIHRHRRRVGVAQRRQVDDAFATARRVLRGLRIFQRFGL